MALHKVKTYIMMDKDEKEANECRIQNGLQKLIKTKVHCLRCNDLFITTNSKTNRICTYCRNQHEDKSMTKGEKWMNHR